MLSPQQYHVITLILTQKKYFAGCNILNNLTS